MIGCEMSDTIKLITPVDGSVYAERPVASAAEIDKAVALHSEELAAYPLDEEASGT